MDILTSLKQHYRAMSLTQIVCVFTRCCAIIIYNIHFIKKKRGKVKALKMNSVHKTEMYLLTFLT